ncbi:secD/SecF GG Motif family protein [Mycobacterium kansasii]|uniref:SecD/SecF GG Motif family protein n=1 Tax=Mycobacterium kansasii TaxID=1768 RepID=A0A1V3WHB3_MYCKA|nr:secD/SecF GG Motif family protein [Mycobacterium kansasii]
MHPARYLSVFLVLLIGVYLLVFLTGDKKATPKLGIDLQGGTRVTLTARTPDGTAPSRQALNQAQQIISARVNGLGVSGSEVVVDGDNLVITVPGNDGNEARNLGQTARLYIRPVLNSMPAQPAQEEPKPPREHRRPRVPGAAALRRAGCAALGRAGCAALGRSGAAAALSAGAATVACSRPQSCPSDSPLRRALAWRRRRPATR